MVAEWASGSMCHRSNIRRVVGKYFEVLSSLQVNIMTYVCSDLFFSEMINIG